MNYEDIWYWTQKLLVQKLSNAFVVNNKYTEFYEESNYYIKNQIESIRITLENKIIPYSILPAEFLTINTQNDFVIRCPKKYSNEIINYLRNINRESEISSLIEASIQPYITNVEKLPGISDFYSSLNSKDHYFGLINMVKGSLSVEYKLNYIRMKAPNLISENLQKDLNQYSSSLS